MSMLKITVLSQVLIVNLLFAANEIDDIKVGDESIEKYGKLSKIRKLFKSQKSAKSKKELSKSGNLSNFDAKKNRSSFLTPDAKTIFNHLWLVFIKALIF